MFTWAQKDPDEVITYQAGFSTILAADSITDSTVEVVSGSAVIDADTFDADTGVVLVTVSGGTSGETTLFKITILTVGGDIYERLVSLDVLDSDIETEVSSTRKRVLIEMAVEELKLAGYEFNFSPAEYTAALRRLDGLAARFPSCGYNTPAAFGQGEVDDPSGLADPDVPDFALLLAEACAPMIGKTLGVTATRRIAEARIRLAAKYAVLPTVQLPGGYPVGAGGRRLTRFTAQAT